MTSQVFTNQRLLYYQRVATVTRCQSCGSRNTSLAEHITVHAQSPTGETFIYPLQELQTRIRRHFGLDHDPDLSDLPHLPMRVTHFEKIVEDCLECYYNEEGSPDSKYPAVMPYPKADTFGPIEGGNLAPDTDAETARKRKKSRSLQAKAKREEHKKMVYGDISNLL